MSFTKIELMLVKLSFILALALALCLNQIACGAGKETVGSTPPAQTSEVTNQPAKEMKIKITIGEKVVTATLANSEAARDFASLLPLTLTLEDYNQTEKISNLPKRLSTKGAPAGSDPAVGDIAYYAPWGNLAIFYRDFGYSSGLVILGKTDGEMKAFSAPGSLKATIELVK
ncbi:MAG: cyclophilin-like fold protein [Blastocatellia bacterium]